MVVYVVVLWKKIEEEGRKKNQVQIHPMATCEYITLHIGEDYDHYYGFTKPIIETEQKFWTAAKDECKFIVCKY